MPKTKKPIDVQAQIDRMVKLIVRKFHPEKIILFGSRARGDARPESDVDLLVVMPVEGSIVELRLDIREALRRIPIPVDVIVTSPDDFAWRKDFVGTIEWPATREGKLLYARRPALSGRVVHGITLAVVYSPQVSAPISARNLGANAASR
jgi:uncharacterized protein